MRSSTPSAAAKLLWLTLLTGAGLVASATAATVYAASDSQRRAASNRPSAQAPDLESSRHSESLRALVDSLLAPLDPPFEPDSANLAQMVALITGAADSATWIAHPAPDSSRVMATYRTWARTAPLPPLWGYRPGFPGVADSRAVPIFRMQALRQMWKANEASADSALLRGDTPSALLRARESIAGARHLLWQPLPIDAMIGRAMLSDGAKLLARTALQADQPTLHSAAQRLHDQARALKVHPKGAWSTMAGLAADPHDRRLDAIAGDRTLLPATRVVALERLVADMCLSTRDVLFGPSRQRHEAIDRLAGSVQDIPRTGELRILFHRSLDWFENTPGAFKLSASAEPSLFEPLLRLVVPTSVYNRVEYCRWAGV